MSGGKGSSRSPLRLTGGCSTRIGREITEDDDDDDATQNEEVLFLQNTTVRAMKRKAPQQASRLSRTEAIGCTWAGTKTGAKQGAQNRGQGSRAPRAGDTKPTRTTRRQKSSSLRLTGSCGNGIGRVTEDDHDALQGIFLGPLPHDLITAILQRLPLPAVVRLRLLSSAWNALLCSPTYVRLLCDGEQQQAPWLVTVRITCMPESGILFPKELTAYIPALGSWLVLPISMHPHLVAATSPGLLQVPLHKYLADCPIPSSLAMASWGGLICTVVTALKPFPVVPKNLHTQLFDDVYIYQMYEAKFRLLVFNCITGASKWLPCPPPPHRICSRPPHYTPGMYIPSPPRPVLSTELHVIMLPDASAPGAYFVVLDHSKTAYPQLCELSIYSSKTGRWRNGHMHASGNPSLVSFDQIQNADLFYYEVYWTPTPSPRTFLSAYAIESDAWMYIYISPPVPRCHDDQTFKWQGRVFLAKLFMEENSYLSLGFVIIEFSASLPPRDYASWKEVARTPQAHMQSHTTEFVSFYFKIRHNGNLVWMTGFFDVEENAPHEPVLVYDLANGSWYKLPPPTCSDGTTTDYGDGVFGFQPNLLAVP